MMTKTFDQTIRQAQLDVTLLTRRAQTTMEQGGSVERLLRGTPGHVLALMPLQLRTPDAVPGSIYDRVASGQVSSRAGRFRMDQACVVHTAYASRWMEHADCLAAGMRPDRIAGCELMDLIA